ncbi:metal-dependent hydrolase [Pseudoduganella aquatica]|uniref:Metal-dependent hydrolase n=1 Tax=Pseudoduganella aquatica TaxID=2660641 RepID=A0A7X4HFK9_9BURK|nr:metal-dependent hydrolase [Pseudoduganella aquatica]MYN09622.1 metal-dependent hydrolase [Pseudoduganella aquatica]
MDNITHTVVGLGVGELVQRSLPAEPDEAGQRTRHRLLLTACAAASNFPDLDLFLTRLLPDPLGYLLQHRGHTHTLLYEVPQALLLVALLWLLWPNARALLRRSQHARAGLGAAVVLGFLLHIGMDFLNSYGVHPFYPFDGRWFYGDMIFIIEPVFWVAFGAPLIMAIGRPWLRWLMLAGLAGALCYFAARGYLGTVSLAALLALGAGLACLKAARRRSRRAMALALLVSVGFVAAQGVAGTAGRQRVQAALQAADPQSRIHDVAMTAFPAQPLCWAFVSIESNVAAGSYRLRRGLVSLAPGWLPPQQCPSGLLDPPPHRAAAPGVELYSEVSGKLAELRSQADGNCWLSAWLRFARMPAITGATASDMRFATTPRGNFTTLDLAATAGRACPAGVPAWTPPRADLLAR